MTIFFHKNRWKSLTEWPPSICEIFKIWMWVSCISVYQISVWVLSCLFGKCCSVRKRLISHQDKSLILYSFILTCHSQQKHMQIHDSYPSPRFRLFCILLRSVVSLLCIAVYTKSLPLAWFALAAHRSWIWFPWHTLW